MVALISEFGVLLSILRVLLPDSPLGVTVIVTLISVMCAAYVSVGGYAGVLWADLFQLLVFATSIIFLLGTNAATAIKLATDQISPVNLHGPPSPPVITYFLFTVVGMAAFPDMWIRNFSSLPPTHQGTFRFLNWSIVGLLIKLIPISLVGLLVFRAPDSLDGQFIVARIHAFYARFYLEQTGTVMNGFSGWCVVACLICAFVTTTDTYLIGMAQLLGAGRRTNLAERVCLIPYVASIGALIVARVLVDTDRGLYVIGLIVFPFLWFNTIFLLAGAFPDVKAFRSVPLLRGSIAVGLLLAVSQIWMKWETLESHPHMPVVTSGMCVYSVFLIPWITKVLRKFGGGYE